MTTFSYTTLWDTTQVRDLERLLGRKTMEVEILKEALDVARVKKQSLQLKSWNGDEDGSR
jgi:transposase